MKSAGLGGTEIALGRETRGSSGGSIRKYRKLKLSWAALLFTLRRQVDYYLDKGTQRRDFSQNSLTFSCTLE